MMIFNTNYQSKKQIYENLFEDIQDSWEESSTNINTTNNVSKKDTDSNQVDAENEENINSDTEKCPVSSDQLAEASEMRLREFFGLPTSTFSSTSILNCNELANTDLNKAETECSSVSMYANICDMFDRHDVTNDIVEVVGGADDVELLNDVEIDVKRFN
ncbi:hypothetical protein EVAR_72611_1 [Eumeta japonica]|uniref:Uncharacterized protein n=1 Tax=Eumeta variegata TaxID=151549 RepID=A0A4C1T7R9_EUMVA|nr:hypothetical protein EVAR_72611_1 [Eumeta japonica]